MANTMLKMPYFARGTYEKLQEALDTGVFKELDRIIWCVLTDIEHNGQLAFVDVDKNITIMKADMSAELQPIIDHITELAQKADDLENGLIDVNTRLADTYTKQEVDDLIQTQAYSKDEIDQMINTVDEQIQEMDEKVDKRTEWNEI